MKCSLILLFLTLFNATLFGQTTFAYQLDKGDVFTIKQQAKQVITQELDGASHIITNTIDGILQFKVLGEENKNYVVSLTFKDLNLKMTSSIQGELMNVRAKQIKEGDIQSRVFHTILNNPIKLILAKNGNILEVQGGDSLVSKMAKASGLKDKFSLNMMKKSLQKEFGSEALSNSYKQMTYIYPNNKIKIHDQWQNTYSGTLTSSNTWTLIGVTNNRANISGKAKVNMDVKDPSTSMKLSGTQTTKVQTDMSSGFIVKMEVNGKSSGTSTIAQMSDQEIPTTITSKTTYELINL
ncbi:hypothetical protein SAMN04487911_106108 [Arenibacter nanhaiticus]|uniref:Uncharacterized protein n=1 Tax=Arenibacter nanhaiticus TaxID=558155 RepID=A0A1M6ED16_9FLAO|nr:DUF6263 family protein [Arenibacter nanhaiticus]SHI83210.1 hypothetical protein SAMN04487911_106108 [Arenibacter nanhaiticus]